MSYQSIKHTYLITSHYKDDHALTVACSLDIATSGHNVLHTYPYNSITGFAKENIVMQLHMHSVHVHLINQMRSCLKKLLILFVDIHCMFCISNCVYICCTGADPGGAQGASAPPPPPSPLPILPLPSTFPFSLGMDDRDTLIEQSVITVIKQSALGSVAYP